MDERQPSAGPTLPGPVAITGAASGIGYAVARLAIDHGASVAMLDRSAAGLAQAADQLGPLVAAGCELHTEVLDVADEQAVEAAFDALHASLGPVAGLVTSAGIERTGVAHELSTATFDEVMATNVRGSFLCARAAIRQMLKRGNGGSIVCVSSTFARTAAPAITAYGASKGATTSLARSLAIDYAPDGIRVNALLPGPTDTALMWGEMSSERVDEVRKLISNEVPLGRLASPEEPAAAALWLLSDWASYVTGAEIACDGGVLAKSSVSV